MGDGMSKAIDPRITEYAQERISSFVEEVTTALEYELDAPLRTGNKGERTSLLGACESPIEQLLLISLLYMQVPLYEIDQPIGRPKPDASTSQYSPATFDNWAPAGGVTIFPQQQISGYRIDFLLVAKFGAGRPHHRIVIECDGHDYHERTKEQAQRDKKRDRTLQALGYQVFRFTGSEIWRDPTKCADEVRRYLEKIEYETRDI